MAVSNILNSNNVIYTRQYIPSLGDVAPNSGKAGTYTIPTKSGYTAYVLNVHIAETTNEAYGAVNIGWRQDGNTLNYTVVNSHSNSGQVAPQPLAEILYVRA